jgi:predicted TIM-barrel fold metal-dependent hydrolase
MIIDCHAHIGKDVFGERKNILNFNGTPQKQSIEEFLAKMSNLGIDRAIIYPFPSPLKQFEEDNFWYHKENRYLMKFVEEYRQQLYFIPAVNPADKRSIDYCIELVERYNLKGLKIHTRPIQYEPRHLDLFILDFLKNKDLPLVLHIGSGKEPELVEKGVDTSLDSAIHLAKNYPHNRFVFAHLGRLHKNLEEALKLENVMVDTSGLSVKRLWKDYSAKNYNRALVSKSAEEIISVLVEKGYSDKIMWGSDEPYGASYNEELQYVKDNKKLDEYTKKKILSENAIKWFKLWD